MLESTLPSPIIGATIFDEAGRRIGRFPFCWPSQGVVGFLVRPCLAPPDGDAAARSGLGAPSSSQLRAPGPESVTPDSTDRGSDAETYPGIGAAAASASELAAATAGRPRPVGAAASRAPARSASPERSTSLEPLASPELSASLEPSATPELSASPEPSATPELSAILDLMRATSLPSSHVAVGGVAPAMIAAVEDLGWRTVSWEAESLLRPRPVLARILAALRAPRTSPHRGAWRVEPVLLPPLPDWSWLFDEPA